MPGHVARHRPHDRYPRAFGAIVAGDNAIHKLGAILDRLTAYQARQVDIDGCVYREGLSAVRIDGGIAGNVIPDAASVTVNFRFAPDRSVEQALAHVHEVFAGLDVSIELTDSAAGALPGLTQPAAAALVAAAGDRCARSTAGPTWHALPPLAFRRSTMGRVTRTWRTRSTNGCRRRPSPRPPRCCGGT